MGKYFTDFYKRVFPHLTNITVDDFYGKVFSWYVVKSDADITFDRSLLEKWVRGDRDIPRKILIQAMTTPEAAAEQYDAVFRPFLKELKAGAEDSGIMLEKSLEIMQETFPVSIHFENNYVLPAKALTTALVCDGILGDERLIEAGLRNAIKKKLAACKKDDVFFSFMYILGILLNTPNRLLGYMLERCSSGQNPDSTPIDLKAKWESRTAAYAAKTEHKPYTNISLNNIEVLQHAKLLAYSNLNQQTRIAGELEVCRAIVRCQDESSSTVCELKSDIGETAAPAKWDALALGCYDKMYKTTV